MPSDHPQTPQSPSQNSPGSHELTLKPTTSPRFNNSLPTPAHSINGSMSSTISGFAADGASLEESSNKRKRDIDDHGDREQKKVHVEDSGIRIDDLHLDVGKKYLLCHPPRNVGRKPTEVDMTSDLFAKYGLEEIAASVARVDDDGKKKIVRKTYKNYMRSLSGAFDPPKKEPGSQDTNDMLSMMLLPEEEWDATMGRSTQVEKGLPEEALANLGKAVTMTRGVIPRTVWKPNVLGELNSTPAYPAVKTDPNGIKKQAPFPHSVGVPRTIKGEAVRPKRATKKRSYGDSSFEGYGEGFVDDDIRDAGSFTGGDDDDDKAGGRKRPKKVRNLLHQLIIVANKLERTLHRRIFKVQRGKAPAMVLEW
ncbi:Mediator of RNA polymerase II transcription subunit 19 [Hyphodiscus hymeniophilus]|uniref:Mediator of RNA polymerase II transcription subunit 19 n=1 Tax=Hyphodiscus hymeniophilus TaxID=353542 RepID=A0A9P7AWL7_9HELO|nr:Mediator of RNA polymerase II transcription subunit 19 [Hyphodiscus hymeniophilus]